MVQQFMVDCTLPTNIPEELIQLLPIQQEVLGKYMTEGKLIHYALSLENSKLWAIVNANSEIEVFEMMLHFPLAKFIQFEVSLLNAYDYQQAPAIFSLN